MGHMVIALRVNNNPMIEGEDLFGKEFHWSIDLPDGAVGICYVFKSKAAALKYYGKGVRLCRIKYDEKVGSDED